MNKHVEFTTPSLLDISEEIVKHVKLGYEIKRGIEQIGYLFHVELVLPDEAEQEEAPKQRGRKPKAD